MRGESMPDFIERRRSRRIPVSYPIKYKIAGEDGERAGVCVNISGSGILFRTDEIIKPGRALEIHIEPDDRLAPPLTANIEVVRCTPAPEPGFHHVAGAIKGIKSE
ncbi:PilZ domain-containing protein [Methylococcus geothermalis]|uniref:PilZ domain-containing protein n=1 Tax=Methylococcus geothermalis TaxID=2681310 RepID=A0A858QBQ9_9GAMM|nr:PilZ domain-containing protein [Methylococcus geothermalis]